VHDGDLQASKGQIAQEGAARHTIAWGDKTSPRAAGEDKPRGGSRRGVFPTEGVGVAYESSRGVAAGQEGDER
jgi:hypothetical protein